MNVSKSSIVSNLIKGFNQIQAKHNVFTSEESQMFEDIESTGDTTLFDMKTKYLKSRGFAKYADAKWVKETSTINKVTKVVEIIKTGAESIAIIGGIVFTAIVVAQAAKQGNIKIG